MLVELADAVVTELNGSGWPIAFRAVRRLLPRYRLQELGTLHVTVVPRSDQSTPQTRGRVEHAAKIDIAVQQRCDDVEADAPALLDLAERIAGHFLGERLEYPAAICTAAAHEPIYSPEHLAELRQFTAVVRLTFLVSEARG